MIFLGSVERLGCRNREAGVGLARQEDRGGVGGSSKMALGAMAMRILAKKEEGSDDLR